MMMKKPKASQWKSLLCWHSCEIINKTPNNLYFVCFVSYLCLFVNNLSNACNKGRLNMIKGAILNNLVSNIYVYMSNL